ncbi:hypothetical protein OG871_40540 (plasmid) [Kitasatospora sp. NBC_00374]|uniref:hypothetical protein n=1 Tax=Kitasatospora sp. NBC_00374 TaxID=2975964 RepID=UPI002F9161FF
MNWDLTPGTHMSRAELHRRFGGRIHPRISPSKSSPNVLLFTTSTAGSRFDGWTGQHVHFRGEGADGTDQKLAQGNKSVLRHVTEGRALRLFRQPETGPTGTVEYLGECRIDSDRPFVWAEAPGDPHRPLEVRRALVFQLLPLGEPPRGLPTAAPARLERTVTAISATALANHLSRETEVPSRQAAGNLMIRYAAFLRWTESASMAHYRITTGHSVTPLYVELLNLTRNELVVPLASCARPGVWEALGRLRDQARYFETSPRGALLLPGAPDPDLAELLRGQDVTAVWPCGPLDFTRADPKAADAGL